MARDVHNDWVTTGREDRPPVHQPPADPAAESLSSALHVSFRLLRAIMIFIVVAFFLTGLRSVKEGQAAIVYRFGQIVATKSKGLCVAWPFPIGRIELVDLSERKLRVDDFWLAEPPEERAKPMSERRIPSQGLRPEWDGALFTGDGNLVHVRLTCNYQIQADPALGIEDDPLVWYKTNVDDSIIDGRSQTEELLRSIICREAIRLAGGQTAERLRLAQDEFRYELAKAVQAELKAMRTGMGVNTITMRFEWPLRVRQDYEAATAARQEAEKEINEALAKAEERLIQAAGPNYKLLVGEADDTYGGLIGQYALAVEQGRREDAEQTLAAIEALLDSPSIAGSVGPEIARAKAEKNAMIDMLAGRVNRYQQLLPEFLRQPDFVVQRLWAETRDEILSQPSVEKYYLPPGDGKVVVKIDRDPSAARRLQRARLQGKGDE